MEPRSSLSNHGCRNIGKRLTAKTEPGRAASFSLATCSERLKPRAARLPISSRCAIAETHAMARVTIASIFFDAFSLAMRQPGILKRMEFFRVGTGAVLPIARLMLRKRSRRARRS